MLHTHGYRPDFVDAPVARGLGISTVTTVHGFTGGGGLKGRLYERLQLRAFRRMDAVLAVSEKLRGELIRAGVPGARVHAVRNAYAPEGGTLDRASARRVLGIDTTAPVIGWIGRMSADYRPARFFFFSSPGAGRDRRAAGRSLTSASAATCNASTAARMAVRRVASVRQTA